MKRWMRASAVVLPLLLLVGTFAAIGPEFPEITATTKIQTHELMKWILPGWREPGLRIGGYVTGTAWHPDGTIFGRFRKHNLIPNAAETALRDCFNANAGSACTGSVAVFKYHGIGTGVVAAAEGDTGCGTELTTQYNPDSTRATGSQTTNGANVYRTVGTNTIDSGTPAVTEWCLHQAATGAVTMWSRVVFAAINLAANDSLQTTYDLTIE